MNAFDEAVGSGVVEHVLDVFELMEEIHRVMKKKARLTVRTTYWESENAYADPGTYISSRNVASATLTSIRSLVESTVSTQEQSSEFLTATWMEVPLNQLEFVWLLLRSSFSMNRLP